MSVILIHPPVNQVAVTGGNIYNAHVLQQADTNNFPLVSFPLNYRHAVNLDGIPRASSSEHLLLWDSLFISLLAQQGKSFNSIEALLLHYLPSENPMLSAFARDRLRTNEENAISRVDGLIATGVKLMNRIKTRWPDKRVFLCEPGIAKPFLRRKAHLGWFKTPHRLQLLTVANITPAKGHMALANILSTLPTNCWHWHLVGHTASDRRCFYQLRKTIDRSKIGNQVTFHGLLKPNRLAHLMDKMDIYLSTSRFESYGMAVAEAVAKGLPVVTIRAGENDRLVIHNKNGFVVEQGEYKRFRRYLTKLITNRRLYRNFRQQQRVEKLRWEDTFSCFRRACESIMGDQAIQK